MQENVWKCKVNENEIIETVNLHIISNVELKITITWKYHSVIIA